MVLQTFNPSKAMNGLNELEYINRFPLVIRQIIKIKATLANLLLISFLLAAHLIQGSYIIVEKTHFCQKMIENGDIDFLGDHSLPGITCFHDPITPRKFPSQNFSFKLYNSGIIDGPVPTSYWILLATGWTLAFFMSKSWFFKITILQDNIIF